MRFSLVPPNFILITQSLRRYIANNINAEISFYTFLQAIDVDIVNGRRPGPSFNYHQNERVVATYNVKREIVKEWDDYNYPTTNDSGTRYRFSVKDRKKVALIVVDKHYDNDWDNAWNNTLEVYCSSPRVTEAFKKNLEEHLKFRESIFPTYHYNVWKEEY